jgi:hypothetical protein
MLHWASRAIETVPALLPHRCVARHSSASYAQSSLSDALVLLGGLSCKLCRGCWGGSIYLPAYMSMLLMMLCVALHNIDVIQ